MIDTVKEKRHFTRIEMALPVQVRQGSRVWQQRLVEISLRGLSTDRPAAWDGRVSEPFTLVIDFEEGSSLELQARVQHITAARLGFLLLHQDLQSIEPLRAAMRAHMDISRLEEELDRLN